MLIATTRSADSPVLTKERRRAAASVRQAEKQIGRKRMLEQLRLAASLDRAAEAAILPKLSSLCAPRLA
jgi:hypothetical protein